MVAMTTYSSHRLKMGKVEIDNFCQVIGDIYGSLSYKGHCVLCKDVLSFVFQTFDFQVLSFGFCVLCC